MYKALFFFPLEPNKQKKKKKKDAWSQVIPLAEILISENSSDIYLGSFIMKAQC